MINHIKNHFTAFIKTNNLTNLTVGHCITYNGSCVLCLDGLDKEFYIWDIKSKTVEKRKSFSISDPNSIKEIEKYLVWVNKNGRNLYNS